MTNDEIILYLEENGFYQRKETNTLEKKIIQSNEKILISVFLENSIDKIRVAFVLKNKGKLYTFEFVLKMSSVSKMGRVIKIGIAFTILMKIFYKIEAKSASVSIESKKLFDINMVNQFYCIDENGHLYVPSHNYPMIRSYVKNKREYFEFIKNGIYSEPIFVDDLIEGKYNNKTLDELFPEPINTICYSNK